MKRTSLSSVLLLSSLSVSAAFNVEKKATIVADHLQSFNKVVIASTIAILGWSGDYQHVDMHHPPPAYALKEKMKRYATQDFSPTLEHGIART